MTTVIPYLLVDGAAEAIEFYEQAFDAREVYRITGPGDKVGHAEIMIGDSRVMLADEWPDADMLGPTARGGPTTTFSITVDDADALDIAWARALRAGATEDDPVQDQFYGLRSGALRDPFGHRWVIGTMVEDLSPEEIQRRSEEAFGS